MLGCPFADWRHRNVERWHWEILQKTWRTEEPISFWYVLCFVRFPAGSPLPPVEPSGSSFSWIETEVWLTRRQWRCCCRTKRPVGTFGCLAWKFSTNKRNKQQKQLKHVKFQSKTVRSQLTDSTSNQFKSIDVTALNRNSRISQMFHELSWLDFMVGQRSPTRWARWKPLWKSTKIATFLRRSSLQVWHPNPCQLQKTGKLIYCVWKVRSKSLAKTCTDMIQLKSKGQWNWNFCLEQLGPMSSSLRWLSLVSPVAAGDIDTSDKLMQSTLQMNSFRA